MDVCENHVPRFIYTSDDETLMVFVCDSCRQFTRRPMTDEDRVWWEEEKRQSAIAWDIAWAEDARRLVAGEYDDMYNRDGTPKK